MANPRTPKQKKEIPPGSHNKAYGDVKWDVCELFAGVGGFRVGLQKSRWKVIFSNQWEPGAKKQHASDCYVRRFGKKGHSNRDISEITEQLTEKPDAIPDHDLLVGGFPCQDYSVATTKAKGIVGRKGVLWWDIHEILKHKRPRFVLLENVDRLLSSPSAKRGRDFGVILACMRDLGYAVEWRVINAAEYGFPQKRRRTFIFGTAHWIGIGKEMMAYDDPMRIIQHDGLFARAFPVKPIVGEHAGHAFKKTVQQVSDDFTMHFGNAGVMLPEREPSLWTCKTAPVLEKPKPLGKILIKGTEGKDDLEVDAGLIWKKDAGRKSWEYVKGPKHEERLSKEGYKYFYTEGGIPFPDNLDQPSRTLLTGDGNRRPNRTGHLILDPWTKKYRVLSPIEAERLNGFDDDWTKDMPGSKRYFCMGNALVVGVVKRLGHELRSMIKMNLKGKKLRSIARKRNKS